MYSFNSSRIFSILSFASLIKINFFSPNNDWLDISFIKKSFEEGHLFIQLFYGPRLKRKELSELFFNWRKSKNRSLKEKNKIISISNNNTIYNER